MSSLLNVTCSRYVFQSLNLLVPFITMITTIKLAHRHFQYCHKSKVPPTAKGKFYKAMWKHSESPTNNGKGFTNSENQVKSGTLGSSLKWDPALIT